MEFSKLRKILEKSVQDPRLQPVKATMFKLGRGGTDLYLGSEDRRAGSSRPYELLSEFQANLRLLRP